MSSGTFVLFGSGPGIGIAVANIFAQKHFDQIVLCSRNADRLASEKSEVEEAAKKVGRSVQVSVFPTDISSQDSLRKTFREIEKLGPVGCVYHNAARINPTEALTTSVEEIEEDFKTGNLSLYIIAQWAVPLLQNSGKSGNPRPSLFVTNSHLPEEPLAFVLSLSMSKAAQQNMMGSLEQTFGKDIHFGVIKVCGPVSPEHAVRNPTNIAEKAYALFEQEKSKWEFSVSIRE